MNLFGNRAFKDVTKIKWTNLTGHVSNKSGVLKGRGD
jgi:hypothetical protein